MSQLEQGEQMKCQRTGYENTINNPTNEIPNTVRTRQHLISAAPRIGSNPVRAGCFFFYLRPTTEAPQPSMYRGSSRIFYKSTNSTNAHTLTAVTHYYPAARVTSSDSYVLVF